jgi:23S rRNA pseudouridine955/2504/2580 synthase
MSRGRDERNKERSKNRSRARFDERANPRQSDLRVKHSPKREGGRGRAFPARPPREQPVVFQPAPPSVAAPKAVQFSAGVQTVAVTPDENGMRVDRFFEGRFPGLSFSHIQRIIRKGDVRVNGKRRSSSTRPSRATTRRRRRRTASSSSRSRFTRTTTCWCSTSRWG